MLQKLTKMEKRQKYMEEVLKRQQKHIFKISKELELHREFLNLQFESFMDYLFQNGAQLIRVSKRNGIKDNETTGVFFPVKNSNNKNREGSSPPPGSDDKSPQADNEEPDKTNEIVKHNGVEDEEDTDEDMVMEELPAPQAILGENDCVSLETISEQDRGSVSRRSSSNVVSSSGGSGPGQRLGNGHEEIYDEEEEGEDEGEYVDAGGVQPEIMKYDMNHFMFSHFMDGGEAGAGGEQDGEVEDYDDDEEIGMYDDSEEVLSSLIEPTNRNNSNTRRSLPTRTQQQSSTSNNTVLPPNNIPHNERTCRYCGKTFHWKQSWVIHERTHTGEKPYLCKCGKAFSQKSNMNTHAKSCGQAMATRKGSVTVFQMKCSYCQKMFTHKKNLDLHVEKFHPGVLNLSVGGSGGGDDGGSSSSRGRNGGSPYNNSGSSNAAALMEAVAAQKAAQRAAENAAILQILRNAQQQQASTNEQEEDRSVSPLIEHGNNSNSGSVSSGGDDRNGRYPCPYCPKRFPVKGTLERHLRVHTGEKPFLCGICGKAFTQKGSVKLHLERVHRQSM